MSVLTITLVAILTVPLQRVLPVHSQGGPADVTAIVLLEHVEDAKEVVMAIEALGAEVLAGTAHAAYPAVLVSVPEDRIDAIVALDSVVAVQTRPSRLWEEAASIPTGPITGLSGQPGHGSDGSGEEELTPEERVSKAVTGSIADELATILAWHTLADSELAKIEGAVRSQAYWVIFTDERVADRLVAEVEQILGEGPPSALTADSVVALEAAANEQTVSVIIQLDGPADAEELAAISSSVLRQRHVLESINAISADLTPAQLASVARLPRVRHIWPNAPVRAQLDESVPQIGADDIHALGIGGNGVRIAVVEARESSGGLGLQDDHPAYNGRVVSERYNEDTSDHATHVAGIIAGNNAWITGVAPSASLVDAVVRPSFLEPLWDDVIEAIEWAADDSQGDADVINISLGADLWVYPRDGTGPVETAVDNVITQDGVDSYHTMVVKSAGNDAERHDTGNANEHPDPDLVYIYWHDVDVGVTDKLQITLWWDDSSNDLDLKLYEPGGTEVDVSNGSPGSAVGTNPGIVYEQVSASTAELQNYGTGIWRVKVIAHDVPNDPQFYHAAIDTGDADFTSPNPVGTTTVPGNARYALTVGSVQDGSWGTTVNQRSDFSSQGPTADDPNWDYRIKPEIMAPGEWIYSSVAGSDYETWAGTSMAAPHVAGAVALLLEAAGRRSDGSWQLNYFEVRGAIIDTAQVIDGDSNIDNVTGAGLVAPTNAVFRDTITDSANRYFKVIPKYTSATYPGVTGQVLSFGWESVASHWNSSINDLDLYLYRLDTGSLVASGTSTNPTYEKIDGVGAASDQYNYVLHVYGWHVDGTEAFYGVSTNDIESVEPPSLNVIADSSNPDEVDIGETFTVRFRVQNNGGLPALNTSAVLGLPSGVELVSGSNPQSLGSIQPGGEATTTWSVRANTSGTKSFTVNAASNCWGPIWWDAGSDTVTVSSTAPSAPTNVSASDGIYTDMVLVAWPSSSGADSYEVYRATSSGGTKTKLGSPTGTSYDDTSAAVGTTYYYWVKACNSYGCSDYSDYDTGYRSGTPPSTVTNVSASDGTYTDRVQVDWDSSSGADYYEVYRATSSGGTKTNLGSPTGTSYDDTSAAVGTTYYYWVKACNSYGCSEYYSGYDTGYRAGTVPSAPINVQASDGAYTDRVRVDWDSTSGATYYEVYRATSSGGTKTLLYSPSGTSYDDTSAAEGSTYYYWVKACNSWGCSGYSGYDTGYRSGIPPSAPTGVAASDGTFTDEVLVAWWDSSGATYSEVYRATSSGGTKTKLGSTTSAWYEDTNVAAGTTYYYWVKACNSWGCSGYSEYDTGYATGPIPAPPTNVQASDGAYNDRVRVTWDSTSGATYYEVYRATSSGGTKTLLGSPSGTSYDDTSAVAATIYYYWVKACNTYGCSDYSGYDEGDRTGPIPASPTNVQATDGTYTDRVRVTWDSSSGADYYDVYRATSSGGTKTKLGSPAGTSYDDTSAATGTTYYYWVTACNYWGCSWYSDYDTGYRGGTAPSPPTNVSANDGNYFDKVRVTWDSSSGATYYEVYRATSSGGTKTLLSSPSGTSYDDTSAAVGTTYYYWVKACDSYGCSEYSAYDTGYLARHAPNAPTNVQASDGAYTDRVRVTWDSSSGADYYEIYRWCQEDLSQEWLTAIGTSYDDSSTAVLWTYYYWVKACNSWGCSDYSDFDTGYRGGIAPSAPTNLSASKGNYTDRVQVDWDSSSGADNYEVYRATSSGGTKTLLGSPSGTSYDDTSAVVGTTYYYWVKACNSYGCSDYSDLDTGYAGDTAPSAPTNVSASDGNYTDRVQVDWDSSTGADNYEVYRATSSGGTKTLLGSPSGTSYDDTSTVVGSTYYYWVKACNNHGCSDYSTYDTGYATGAIPAPPTNVQASDGTYTDRVRVKWDSSTGADNYDVYRATSLFGTKTLLYSPLGTSYDDTSAAEGSTYYYWVTACNTYGCSDYSAYDTGYVTGAIPAPPTNVQASDGPVGAYTDRVRVTWDISSGATYYEVYRATYPGGTKSLLGSSSGTSYDETSAVAATIYYYWVKACNTYGCSDYSAYDTGFRAGTPTYLPLVLINH